MSIIDELIYDRTRSDVDYARTLKKRAMENGLSNLSSAELDAYMAGLKGAYDSIDYNRVESAVAYIAQMLHDVPISLKAYAVMVNVGWDTFFDVPYSDSIYNVTTKTNWAVSDQHIESDMSRYLNNVKRLITALEADYPDLPDSMAGIDFAGANAIEQALVLLYEALLAERARITDLLDRTATAFWYSAEVWAGEV